MCSTNLLPRGTFYSTVGHVAENVVQKYIETQKQIIAAQELSKSGGLEQIKEALGYIKNKDMVSPKSIYRRLFKKIVVRPLGAAKVELQFIFNNMTTSIGMGEGKCMEGQIESADMKRARKRAI